MTSEEAIKMLEAQIECNRIWVSGVHDCSTEKCESCKLTYAKGNMHEQRQCFEIAVKSLKQNSKLKEAIGKIKEEIELVTKFGNSFQPIEHGLLFSIIDKHTEGLV